jgi:hypothetical protein
MVLFFSSLSLSLSLSLSPSMDHATTQLIFKGLITFVLFVILVYNNPNQTWTIETGPVWPSISSVWL